MKKSYLYDDITEQVWKAFRKLMNEFRAHPGLSEIEKRNALYNALKKQGLAVSKEVPVIHRINGERVGVGYMDLVIDCRVVVEVKNVTAIQQKNVEQLESYMKDSGLPVGVLLNFGFTQADLNDPSDREKVYKRLYNGANDPVKEQPNGLVRR